MENKKVARRRRANLQRIWSRFSNLAYHEPTPYSRANTEYGVRGIVWVARPSSEPTKARPSKANGLETAAFVSRQLGADPRREPCLGSSVVSMHVSRGTRYVCT